MAKILIIEDYKSQAIELKDDIERKLKFKAYIALDGIKGLMAAKELKPDLIILDLGLPKLSGFEVCKEISNDKSLHKIPIIITTAVGTDEEDKIKGINLGAVEYIIKPYNRHELLGRINNLIHHTAKHPFNDNHKKCNFNLSCITGREIGARSSNPFSNVISRNNLCIDTSRYDKFSKYACCEEWMFLTKSHGNDLFNRIFLEHPAILRAYTNAKANSRDFDLTLCFESDLDFLKVPVEFLHSTDGLGGNYLCLNHPLSHRLTDCGNDLNEPLSPHYLNKFWEKRKVFKVLLIASDADETGGQSDCADEEISLLKKQLEDSLNHLDLPHNIECVYSKKADYVSVVDLLKGCKYHLLHYAGHGFYKDHAPAKSYLPFYINGGRKEVERLYISSLSNLLRGSSLSFVYLNCCSSSRACGNQQLIDSDFPGLSVAIIKSGIPTVLGYRCEVKEQSALNFSRYFYASLFKEGYPDKAVYNARNEIFINNPDDSTWIASVLIDQR